MAGSCYDWERHRHGDYSGLVRCGQVLELIPPPRESVCEVFHEEPPANTHAPKRMSKIPLRVCKMCKRKTWAVKTRERNECMHVCVSVLTHAFGLCSVFMHKSADWNKTQEWSRTLLPIVEGTSFKFPNICIQLMETASQYWSSGKKNILSYGLCPPCWSISWSISDPVIWPLPLEEVKRRRNGTSRDWDISYYHGLVCDGHTEQNLQERRTESEVA